ncbi:MAG: tRNA (adenosine(37)-N6)-dimethylallyltransferase MiaA [Lachnospiraceae bacterium]|nr:tRNA (adenosine(37)-N6)-dimethylallyltransferase MiaA [Lachnospiraceae bacterium]
MKRNLVVVAGPTAVGKTEYAIKFAENYNGEIISLDSVQVYKYLDIGSAKPSKTELLSVKHYMIDEVEPNINLNVKEYKEMVDHYIELIYSRNKLPILVGGTGFYIKAILYDTDFLYEDETDAKAIRKQIYEKLENEGIDSLYEELRKVDPDSIEKIPKENVRRVIRAIEFYRLHNIPISVHNKIENKKESKYNYKFYVLNMDRDLLYNRINKRVDMMIEKGLLKEVKTLINMGLTKDMNSMKSIGYSELYDFCSKRDMIENIKDLDDESKIELNSLIDLIKQHSRNYAKRQLTWFKAQKNIVWVDVNNEEE